MSRAVFLVVLFFLAGGFFPSNAGIVDIIPDVDVVDEKYIIISKASQEVEFFADFSDYEGEIEAVEWDFGPYAAQIFPEDPEPDDIVYVTFDEVEGDFDITIKLKHSVDSKPCTTFDDGVKRKLTAKMVTIKIEEPETPYTDIEADTNAERTKFKISALWPSGTSKEGQLYTDDSTEVYIEEEDTDYYSGEVSGSGFFSLRDEEMSPDGMVTIPEGEGSLMVLACSLSTPKALDYFNRLPPKDASLKARGFSTEGSLSIPQWVDNKTFSRGSGGVSEASGGNGAIDWVEQRAWSVLTGANAATEDGEVFAAVLNVGSNTDERTGITYEQSCDWDPFSVGFRLDESEGFTKNIYHEARHAWQNLIIKRTGSGYDNDDSDPWGFDDPDNDDDPGFFSDGDRLPEKVYKFGNPSLGEWASAVSDGTPIKDDDDSSAKAQNQATDMREDDAWQFGEGR